MVNKIHAALLAALVLLPLSSLIVHMHVHQDFPMWAVGFTVVDIVVITALLAYSKTKTYGFWLNAVFCIVGMIYHAQYSLMGTLSDNLTLLADLLIGYAVLMTAGALIAKGRKR